MTRIEHRCKEERIRRRWKNINIWSGGEGVITSMLQNDWESAQKYGETFASGFCVGDDWRTGVIPQWPRIPFSPPQTLERYTIVLQANTIMAHGIGGDDHARSEPTPGTRRTVTDTGTQNKDKCKRGADFHPAALSRRCWETKCKQNGPFNKPLPDDCRSFAATPLPHPFYK